MSSVVRRNGFVRCGSVLGLVCGIAALVARQAAADACGYPYGSGRTAVVFNESTVLRAFDPVTSQTTVLGQGLTIKAFYSDEHALTLGATSVSVKTASGTTSQCSSALPPGTFPNCVSNPSIGCAGAVDPSPSSPPPSPAPPSGRSAPCSPSTPRTPGSACVPSPRAASPRPCCPCSP